MATIYDRKSGFAPPGSASATITSLKGLVMAVSDEGYTIFDSDIGYIVRIPLIEEETYAVGQMVDLVLDDDDVWHPSSRIGSEDATWRIKRVTDPEVDEILGGWSKDDIISGNYTKIANRLATPRQIALTGDVLGDAYFDGSRDIQIGTAVERITNSQLEGLLK